MAQDRIPRHKGGSSETDTPGMKSVRFAVLVALLVPVTSWAGDVAVSLTVGQPGFYGHIDIGDYPRPEVVYAQPVVIQPVPAGVVVQPVYLHVPPGQEKKWGRYCGGYNACGQPV